MDFFAVGLDFFVGFFSHEHVQEARCAGHAYVEGGPVVFLIEMVQVAQDHDGTVEALETVNGAEE